MALRMTVCNLMLVAKVIYSKFQSPFRSLPHGRSPFIDLVCRNLYLVPSGHAAKVIMKSAMLIVGWQEACFGFLCV